ncbi:MAG: molybdopterin-binding protein [Chloroflexus sp.]|uniref:molybdopterin-binding protein n=1 Tax=Chloroflexus sp. TaxID=1904827 RepID=UPI0021DE2348|nr:molybdopterin-binding protein [Chloroflexus sp.]GIV90602.1 MAG: molybdopterin-binding protein [Chloroflexus sp.]
MRIETLPPAAAVGHILCHNLADGQGRKAFRKGWRLRAEDLPRLAELGYSAVRVAILNPDDVHEDEAALQLANIVAGPGIIVDEPHAGRVNVRAAMNGPLMIDAEALFAINMIDGLTVATLPPYTLVHPGQMLATIKIIPFAVPSADLAQAAAAVGPTGVLHVATLVRRRIGVVLVSSQAARARVERGMLPAIAGRIADLGATMIDCCRTIPDEYAIADSLAALLTIGADLIITAGETSVVDRDDVIPRAIRRLGGEITHYGAPVEPGNLLLLAYLPHEHDTIPLIGAPGCVRSRDQNIVDLILPRLMANERLGRREIVALGLGGLLGPTRRE